MNNWVSFGLQCQAADFRLGADVMNIAANYVDSKAKEFQLKQRGKNLRAKAEQSLKQAGNTQKQGQQAREEIGIQAGQMKGAAIASAAGSGIDVSSKIVNKVVNDIQKQNEDAMAVAAQNEKEAVQNDINDMLLARTENVMNDMAIKTEKRNRKMAVWGGALSAVGNWSAGMADAFSK